MDAREYLARQGIDGERDRERPNTLEEKAWARAREAGDHRPRAGTPHDWEEWERYHDDLAKGAESIAQKIDREAHRRALEHTARSAGDDAVGIVTPPAQPTGGDRSAAVPPESPREAPPALRRTQLALAVLLPPLALALAGEPPRRVTLGLALTLLGWLPGAIYAWRRVQGRLAHGALGSGGDAG
ncbi:YqaE/Pmp3 family membrane protein [Halomonas sp. H10-9-1]|uniref:YqaE/Pmp3 family membrane protein n=1 Tax=Halomonas sp. H10-9-1 TaxID=2950871 RepID=UPI0032DFC994